MIISSIEFFENLPPKECASCGDVIDEMHECYGNDCETCAEEKIL